MSVTNTVFLAGDRLPTAAQLNEALAKEKIDLQLDADWNTRSDSGFWPAKFQGHDAGFEWSVGSIEDAELDEAVLEQVSKYDVAVSLVTHSDLNELASAMLVWGVLTSMAEGLAFSDESGDFFDGAEALALARDQ